MSSASNTARVVIEQLLASSPYELIAVVLAVAYLLLVIRENIVAWYCAFVSTAIFLGIFWQVDLYMESGLQVYYLVMAVYGWSQWRKRNDDDAPALAISTWPVSRHILVLVGVAAAALASGWLLRDTNARLPYIDSFTTWGSIVTTYMVAKKVLENWLYWLVIDSISIFLYIDRGLYFTALLFAAYIVIVIFGGISWYRQWHNARPIS